ncbi:hypothetical protein BN14_00519 [Rhizoctonia solani AG-1 IB]|uniref:Uncharacterized protein n=2 Tax=Rhizoctonia solani TaxID=456999 RepID=A0A8H2WVB0_9AGAM|nr:unnamed protein product [Rhizoctonia solani]CCO26495.1 hypothetical protein BN14_00519 [Rhizoctonia solani AG-1 IB]
MLVQKGRAPAWLHDRAQMSPTSTLASSSTSDASSAYSSTNIPLPPQSTPSSNEVQNLAAQSNSSPDLNESHNNLRTVGIVGGFLAGTALIAIICIILILIRNQRRRGSSASSSFRSRSRTRSNAHHQLPVPFMSQTYGDPLMRPPPLRIHTGDAMTTASHDMTTAGTLGHHSTGMHQFPSVGPGSASSRTTSFGPHSSGASSGGSNVPRRPPQIPSLGLSQPRPLLRSFGSIFSYHASTGHPAPTPTRPTSGREEHEDNTMSSTNGSQTLAATEENVRSDDFTQTEDTGHTDDITRTAETAHSGPAGTSADVQPKTPLSVTA